jgi:hypothetical protein
MAQRSPWRTPPDVLALSPDTRSETELKLAAQLDTVRAELTRLRAGSAALANRAAAAGREVENVRGLHGIGQATATDLEAAEAEAGAKQDMVAEHAARVSEAEVREAELVEALAEARAETVSAFRRAMEQKRNAAVQRLLDTLVEASRLSSEVFGIVHYGRQFGLPDGAQHLIYGPVRADEYSFRDHLKRAGAAGFDVPDLPTRRIGAGIHSAMLDE